MNDSERKGPESARLVNQHGNAEGKLRWLEMAAEQSIDGIAVADLDGIIQFVNPAWAQMHGYGTAELIGQHLSIFHTEEQLQKEVIPFNEQVQNVGAKQGEVGHVRKDGTPFPTWMTSTLLRDEEGNPIGLVGTARDITKPKQAEEALRESEEQYRRLVETMNEGMGVQDENGVFIWVNDRLCEMFGYSRDEIIGRPLTDFLDKANQRRLKEQVSGRRKGKSESYEIVCIGEGGRRIPIIAAASPIFGADGHFGGSFGVLTDITQRKWVEEELKKHRDHLDELVKERTAELTAAIEQLHREITERKRVEGALRESEEKYRSLVERANDGIAIAQDALLKYVNQRLTAMTGYTVEEMINTPFADYIFPGELATVAERYERRMAGEDVTPVYETALRHKDGRRIEVEFNVGMTTYQEKPASLAFVRDITARKQAEEEIRKYTAALEEARNNLELRVEERTKELQEAQEKLLAAERLAVLGQFSGNISHELRNPLGVIDSSVYYLKTKLKDTDPKVTQHLDRIGENVRHSTTIIESLRNLTRVQEPRKVRLDLVAVVDDAFLTSRVPRSVELVREMPEERLFVDGDPEQLRMTFKNIVRNAIDAMGGQGTLTLRTQIAKEGQFAQVAFKDTGPGIAPENLGKIFQPLFSTKVTGLGFGLSICQRIVEQHSGTIEAQSEPGQGATFIVRLPLLP